MCHKAHAVVRGVKGGGKPQSNGVAVPPGPASHQLPHRDSRGQTHSKQQLLYLQDTSRLALI
jgi:hypothetical protein